MGDTGENQVGRPAVWECEETVANGETNPDEKTVANGKNHTEPEMLYWVRRSIDDAGLPSKLKASFTSSITTKFIQIVQTAIKDWCIRVDKRGVLFGGIHRRSIRARYCLLEELRLRKKGTFPSNYGSPFPARCFTSMHADLDYKFPTRECVDELVGFLLLVFKTRIVRRHCEAYNSSHSGCLVTKLVLSPLLDIYDGKVGVEVDLITMVDSTVIFIPDFSSNCLQTTLQEGVPRLELTPALSHFTLSHRSPYSTASTFAKIVGGIETLKTEMLVMSFKRYSLVMAEHCSVLDADKSITDHYDVYISTMFSHRLGKMVRDGWEITNLEFRTVNRALMMPCGHLWANDNHLFESTGDTLRIVTMCSDCEVTHKMFDQFDRLSS